MGANLIEQGVTTLKDLANKAMDTATDIISVRESADVSRMNSRAKWRSAMVSAGKNTIPIAIVAIIAIIFLIVIINKK